jgi:hypothetical protein
MTLNQIVKDTPAKAKRKLTPRDAWDEEQLAKQPDDVYKIPVTVTEGKKKKKILVDTDECHDAEERFIKETIPTPEDPPQ